MVDPLEYLLPMIESQQMTVGNDEVSRWPTGVLQTLTDLGILVSAEDADSIRCPECGEHWEEIFAMDGPGDSTQLFIRCPEVLRIEVTQQHRRQWRPDLSSLMRFLASSLNLKGKPQELFSERLWRLGRLTWNKVSRDVLFVRGLRWPDAELPRAQIVRQRKPILISSTYAMPEEYWKTPPPQLVLRNIAWFADRFEIDVEEVAACIADATKKVGDSPILGVTEEELKLTIRRQIKAENKTELTDDIYVRAYRQLGSLRLAAEFLSDQTNAIVTKDRVKRAIDRYGGIPSLANEEDSNSIVRGVASHHRDRKGKNLATGKPTK
ncbi:hypothetical protein VN12_24030 [Pirellula sp. SH-Sr6A]|uniref:hypothetical protein n=1 Tax=Pirellula sp. SH-Sr6A TaxID=1632865 RepID=UPI00078B6120|nr:hypothetical protein [Pirellula sp. SH-Sr6A]AMV35215.1 hypothetical protein VN12_24030 [Pirellula sp. SH-Sr6A]